ncbi:MAG: NAD(P)/FAD-dependent oxidoreductase [Fimbriimonadaceae bacterium]
MRHATKQRVVILGGGFGGAYAAQRLLKKAPDLDVVLVDRHNYLLYYPLLIEAAVGVIEARHVVVPIRSFLRNRGTFIMAEVQALDPGAKTVTLHAAGEHERRTITYDHIVVALGSVTRSADIPGLGDYGFQLKSLGDGIALRDRAIRLLERANLTDDPVERRALLTVVVVGANFTGVELAGEYNAFLRAAVKAYPNLSRNDISVLLLERADRVLPTVDEILATYTVRTLERRGVRVLTNTSLEAVSVDRATLTSGETVETYTCVWAAGIAPNPLLKHLGLPLNDKGYVTCESDMRVPGLEGVWAIGDAATIADQRGKPYVATAQNASRQGPAVADNIRAVIHRRQTQPFRFGGLGSFASIGDRMAAANVFGVDVKGFAAWIIYRAAYLAKFPTVRIKLRLTLDWIADFFLPYAPVQLGLHRHDPVGSSGEVQEVEVSSSASG